MMGTRFTGNILKEIFFILDLGFQKSMLTDQISVQSGRLLNECAHGVALVALDVIPVSRQCRIYK